MMTLGRGLESLIPPGSKPVGDGDSKLPSPEVSTSTGASVGESAGQSQSSSVSRPVGGESGVPAPPAPPAVSSGLPTGDDDSRDPAANRSESDVSREVGQIRDRPPESTAMAASGRPVSDGVDPIRNKPLQAAAAAPPAERISNGVDSDVADAPRADEAVFHIEVEKVKPNPYQPRKDFDEGELRGLAQSIREFGIIQPLVVSKLEKVTEVGTDVEYQLVAGERRLRAARMIGLERVPTVVRRVSTDKVNLELALIENVQRSDLNPIEAAKAYSRLQDEFGLTQREIASRVGKSREVVANTIRLLNLPSYIQDALLKSQINESHARILLSIADVGTQKRLFGQILSEKISVRRLKEKASSPPDPEKNYFEKRLAERIGAPVSIVRRGGRGRLVIRFYSEDEMRGVVDRLLGDEEERVSGTREV